MDNPFKDKMWTEWVGDFLSKGYELEDAMTLATDAMKSPPDPVHEIFKALVKGVA